MASARQIRKTYHCDLDATPVERNLIILMDGTWNDETGKDGDGVVTNIVKLFRLLEPDSDRQIRRYFRGVGNDEEFGILDQFRGGAFGRKEQLIRDHAYATLAKEYHPGDRIFIFGFSRGAASARMLANDIRQKGIPKTITVTREPVANRFSNNVEYRFVDYESAGEVRPVDVDFLGVWDTVAAFGNPLNSWDPFKNMSVSSNVSKAVHLVGLDETRLPFRPTLMNHNPDVVHEVWFPGVHSDVGGGYLRDELGKLTLHYMLRRADEWCDAQDTRRILRNQQTTSQVTSATLDGPVHFHFHGLPSGIRKLYRRRDIRKVSVNRDDQPTTDLKPLVHGSVRQLQCSAEVFGVVKRNRLFRADTKRRSRIVYNPPALKYLKNGYELV